MTNPTKEKNKCKSSHLWEPFAFVEGKNYYVAWMVVKCSRCGITLSVDAEMFTQDDIV